MRWNQNRLAFLLVFALAICSLNQGTNQGTDQGVNSNCLIDSKNPNLQPMASSGTNVPLYLKSNDAVDVFFEGNTTTGLSSATAHVISGWAIDTSDMGFGIRLEDVSRYIKIRYCTISNTLPTLETTGIELINCENILIELCTFDNNTFTIALISCNNITISQNGITNTDTTAISLASCDYCAIKTNTIASGEEYGIELAHSNSNIVLGNGISGFQGYAIYLGDSDTNTITSNSISVPEGAEGCICEYVSKNNAFSNNGECERDIISFPIWAWIPIGIGVSGFIVLQIYRYTMRKRNGIHGVHGANGVNAVNRVNRVNEVHAVQPDTKELCKVSFDDYGNGNGFCVKIRCDINFTPKIREYLHENKYLPIKNIKMWIKK